MYVGTNGFPIGMAQVQRQLNISRALEKGEVDVTVISRWGAIKEATSASGISSAGVFRGVKYQFCSGTPLYPKNKLLRNILKLRGLVVEFWQIMRRSQRDRLDFLLVNTMSLATLKYYRALSRAFRIKLIYDYVEEIGALRDGLDAKFDEELCTLVDGVTYISDRLGQNLKTNGFVGPKLKVLPVTDYEVFSESSKANSGRDSNYILYCGSLAYLEVVSFVINAFSKASIGDWKLLLVVHGNEQRKKELNDQINASSKSDAIKVRSGLSEEELISAYYRAKALLIPLRDTVQDTARFPHKISEYLATGRPIVTTGNGEIPSYFKHEVDAFIADRFEVKPYAKQLERVYNDQNLADKVGSNGLKKGLQLFDYQSLSNSLINFLHQVKSE